MKKLVYESARDLMYNDRITNLITSMGYKLLNNEGNYIEFVKKVDDGWIRVFVDSKWKEHGVPDENMLKIYIEYYGEQKTLGIKRNKFKYKNYKEDLFTDESFDLGEGLFSLSDKDILKKIKITIINAQDKLDNRILPIDQDELKMDKSYVWEDDLDESIKNKKYNMKKLVSESLQEFMDINEAKKVVKQTPEQKAKEAITALKKQLADVKKPGKMKDTKTQKDAKIKELEEKIAKWEAKLKK